MASLSPNVRGIGLMLLATGVFVINDTCMKLAMADLPPLQVLFMRGVAATIWCLPLLLVLGYGPQLRSAFDRRVLVRNFSELVAVIVFVIALAHMPIADITAIGQISPLVVLIGASLLFGEKLGSLRIGLIALGFIGALLVAQPSGSGLSGYALLGLAGAVASGGRDVLGRRVPAAIPTLVVAFCVIVMVMLGAGIGTALFETWHAPSPRHLLLVAASGLFLMCGHICIFLAYRVGSTRAIAPFYYTFAIWAVLSGALVFGSIPNPLAVAGIALILCSGVIVVLLDERRRRLLVLA